ncbi:MAG: hypothetical protein RMN53_15410 [Anaerolineae bacterium]|nr:hypothetical protein [Anaerolineae bacterium]
MTEHATERPPLLNAQAVREALAGYALADDAIEAERQAALATMTTEEAMAVWRDLMRGFNERPQLQQGLDRLDLWQVEGLLAIRRALDLMAETLKTRANEAP